MKKKKYRVRMPKTRRRKKGGANKRRKKRKEAKQHDIQGKPDRGELFGGETIVGSDRTSGGTEDTFREKKRRHLRAGNG